MDCPVCKQAMVSEDFGGVQVDVCANGCKGIWFDCYELTKLDENNEGVGQALQDALASPRTNDADRGVLNCPKCNIPMHRHQYKSEKEVNVDECYDCGGFFLDSGELKELRDDHMSEQDETAYTDKLLANMPAYVQAEDDLHKQEQRTAALRHYTRFMRLSYYVHRVEGQPDP